MITWGPYCLHQIESLAVSNLVADVYYMLACAFESSKKKMLKKKKKTNQGFFFTNKSVRPLRELTIHEVFLTHLISQALALKSNERERERTSSRPQSPVLESWFYPSAL